MITRGLYEKSLTGKAPHWKDGYHYELPSAVEFQNMSA